MSPLSTVALAAMLLVSASPALARSAAVVAEFRRAHPCPATGQTTGACPGWVVDHLYPLCAGGKDASTNMGWQETRASYVKDRVERELCRCRRAHPQAKKP